MCNTQTDDSMECLATSASRDLYPAQDKCVTGLRLSIYIPYGIGRDNIFSFIAADLTVFTWLQLNQNSLWLNSLLPLRNVRQLIPSCDRNKRSKCHQSVRPCSYGLAVGKRVAFSTNDSLNTIRVLI